MFSPRNRGKKAHSDIPYRGTKDGKHLNIASREVGGHDVVHMKLICHDFRSERALFWGWTSFSKIRNNLVVYIHQKSGYSDWSERKPTVFVEEATGAEWVIVGYSKCKQMCMLHRWEEKTWLNTNATRIKKNASECHTACILPPKLEMLI